MNSNIICLGARQEKLTYGNIVKLSLLQVMIRLL